MKSFKTFALCLALCLVGFVQAAGAQTTQQSANTDDSKASCCSASCCAGGVCHMKQHSAHHHAAAHNASAMKDGCDCCAHCTDACKSGGGDCCKAMGDGTQSCSMCKMGAPHKHASSHHAGAGGRKSDCCAGCTCCAMKDAAK